MNGDGFRLKNGRKKEDLGPQALLVVSAGGRLTSEAASDCALDKCTLKDTMPEPNIPKQRLEAVAEK